MFTIATNLAQRFYKALLKEVFVQVRENRREWHARDIGKKRNHVATGFEAVPDRAVNLRIQRALTDFDTKRSSQPASVAMSPSQLLPLGA